MTSEAALIAQIRSDYDRMLASCELLYRTLEAWPTPAASGDGSAAERLVRVTELIETLESVTFDRIRRVAG
jgi:hypothetical protein